MVREIKRGEYSTLICLPTRVPPVLLTSWTILPGGGILVRALRTQKSKDSSGKYPNRDWKTKFVFIKVMKKGEKESF